MTVYSGTIALTLSGNKRFVSSCQNFNFMDKVKLSLT